MLINLSNHPYNTWGEKQKLATETQFGKVVDLYFPDVDPMADIAAVTSLANNYFLQCKLLLADSDGCTNAIHITGEACFTFKFVNMAKANGITCVCSTTPRVVIYKDCVKTSVFQFVQLRCY